MNVTSQKERIYDIQVKQFQDLVNVNIL